MNSQKTFVFDRYKIEEDALKVTFYYEILENEQLLHSFQEIFQLPDGFDFEKKELIDRICGDLLLIVGISYYKTYCPEKIEIRHSELSEGQAKFWNTVYSIGLGEFYYQNKIDFRERLHFPFTSDLHVAPIQVTQQHRSLVPDGGGKDSIVTIELLKKAGNMEFDLCALHPQPLQYEVAKEAGRKLISCTRVVDPKLIELNSSPEVYNGHVPISLIYFFTHLLLAAGMDYSYVIFSNERSSDYGNVEYLGYKINHQWSKSLECEKLLAEYIRAFITPSIQVFSLLRPWYEIKITQKFADYTQYHHLFSSCNRNFKLDKKEGDFESGTRWCGECAKCAFVFCMMSAFVDKVSLLKIFGKNLYEDPTLVMTYWELLGRADVKPFDCVGTPDEVKIAMFRAFQRGEYQGAIIMDMFETEVMPHMKDSIGVLEKEVFSDGDAENIPDEFKTLVAE